MLPNASWAERNETSEYITPNLEEKVLCILKKDPRLAYREVYCQADSGRLILRGCVRSFFEKQIAQEILRRIEGVGEIHNELEVRSELSIASAWEESFSEPA